jgi:enoyl-CoA hydratase/carnithine racemase
MTQDVQALVLKHYEEEGRIAWLTLNRAAKKNALSTDLMSQLIGHLREIQDDKGVRVVVLSGAGDSFCSGLDLHDLRRSHQEGRRWGSQGATTFEIVRIFRMMPQVVLASVHGWCLGGGLALVAGSDLAIASETAQLGMPEIIRGSYGAVATPTLFHSGLPAKVAFDIQLTGQNLSGVEAARVGLVSRVVPAEQLSSTTMAMARGIAQRHPTALAHAKIAAYMQKDLPFIQALQVDELVRDRMRRFMDPLDDVNAYLKSQKHGTNPGYKKPDA